ACERTVLENFEREKPALEPLIKGLLRTYEGIFNDRVSVYESVLAKNLRLDITSINNGLQELAAAGIIEYLPKKDTPQIQFL
ncbi:hypothetical protein ACSTHG_23750, partial [Vibrio parahaemolyticus]